MIKTWCIPNNIVIGQETLVACELQNGFVCCLGKQGTRMERGSHNVGIR